MTDTNDDNPGPSQPDKQFVRYGNVPDEINSVPAETPAVPASPNVSTRREATRTIVATFLGGGAIASNLLAANFTQMPSPSRQESEGEGAPANTDSAEKGPEFDTMTELMRAETFDHPDHTAGRFFGLADLYKEIAESPLCDSIFLYSIRGNVLEQMDIPQKGETLPWGEKIKRDWPLLTDKHHKSAKYERDKTYWTQGGRKQRWIDLQRARLIPPEGAVIPGHETAKQRMQTGYPFLMTPYTLYAEPKDVGKRTPKEIVEERLNKEFSDSRYFEGKKKTYLEAITEITAEMGVSLKLALGVVGQESGCYTGAKSHKDAHGPFQFLPGTFNRVKDEMNINLPQFREGPIKSNNNKHKGVREQNNVFVQAEAFCIYYLQLREEIAPYLEKLGRRLKELDPNFNTNLEEAAALTCYNAGPGRVKEAINIFVALSDEEIIYRLGPGPYGLDVWLGVIGNSYGSHQIGKDVSSYATKIFGMANTLMPGSFEMKNYGVPREKSEGPQEEEPENDEGGRGGKK